MQNFQIVTEADKTWLICELPKQETIDTYLLSVLIEEDIPSIAKLRDGEDTNYYYDITSFIPLSVYLQQVMSVKQLCLLLKNILEAFEQMRDAMIESDKIYMNPQYIFIEPDKIQPKFICIPSVRSFRHFFLSDFLRHIITSAKLKGISDPAIIQKMTIYLENGQQFKSQAFINYLNHVLGGEKVENCTFSLSGKLNTHSIQLAKPKPVFEKKVTTSEQDRNANNTNTVLAMLTRLNTGENIPIVKSIFRLGKDKESSDYQILGNSAISRCHAMIIAREQHFYIMDLQSTNHTYVNSQMILPNEEREIFHGFRIGLGNEIFYFEVMGTHRTK